MTVVLHDYWRSSASYRVRIALALKGIAYDKVAVDLVSGAQSDGAHLALNPQGLVPVLQIDGLVLTQSLAIIDYLEETRPQPTLMPEAPADRARVRAIAQAVACDIHPVSNLKVLSRVEALAGPEARGEWNRRNIAEGLAAVEALLDHPGLSGRFCHGDAPGYADCVLIPQIYNARRWGLNIPSRLAEIDLACSCIKEFADAFPKAA